MSKVIEAVQKKLSNTYEQIEESKRRIAMYEGREQEIKKNMKELLGTSSIEEAEDTIFALEAKQKKLEKEINDDFETLSEKFGW